MIDWTDFYIKNLRQTAMDVDKIDDYLKKTASYKIIASEFYLMGYEEQAQIYFDKAIENAMNIEDVYYQNWAIGDIIEEMANIGYIVKVKQYLKLLEIPLIKVNAYRNIAGALISQGALYDAKEFLNLAMKSVEEINSAYEKCNALKGIAIEYLRLPRIKRKVSAIIKQIEKLLDEIEVVSYQIITLTNLAEMYSKIKLNQKIRKVINNSKKLIEQISDGYEKIAALRKIAVTLSRIDMAEEAISTLREAIKRVDEISDEKRKMLAFRTIAIELAKLGKFKQAIEIAMKIENDLKRDYTMREIMKSIIEKAEIELATYLLDGIQDNRIKAECQKDIALTLIKYGKLKAAEMIADGISDEDLKILAYGCLMCERIKRGLEELDVSEIVSLKERLLEIEPQEKKNKIVEQFAKYLIEIQMYIEAVDLISRIEDPLKRLWILRDIREEILK